jgi:putative SOS response-associated peptidase YedK
MLDSGLQILYPQGMCGRFIQITGPEVSKVSLFDLEPDENALKGFSPSYNIAPTQDILTVLNTPRPKLTLTRWGLIPFWAKDSSVGQRMINARAETLLAKPSFRDPFRKRRCMILSDGFYEWKAEGRVKTPFFIRMKKPGPFAIAGLWDTWTDTQTGERIVSSTIITTRANDALGRVHDRMPVILEPGLYGTWLSAIEVPDDMLMGCLSPYAPGDMEVYEVSKLVNNPRNNSTECIRPV